jgi:chromosome segregation ATPase
MSNELTMFQQVVTLLSDRMDRMEKTQERLADAVERQATVVEKVATLLAKHEEHRDAIGRAFDEIEADRAACSERFKDHETRIRVIEDDMPTMRLTRNWVIGFTLAGTSGVCLAVLAMVLK